MKKRAFNSTFPHHDQLLLLGTKDGVSSDELLLQLSHFGEKVEWEKVISMGYTHAIIPQFYKTLKQLPEIVPTKHLETLTTLNKEIGFDNIKLSAELITIAKHLDENGLEYLAIKGPALSQTLYGDITQRQICDLDILVKEEDLITIAKLLLKMGYNHRLPLSLLADQGFRDLDNDFTFIHPAKKIVVELHWKLFPQRHKMDLDFRELFKNHADVFIQKQPVKVLSTEHNLLYLSLHASKHVFEQLKWVCDIDTLLRNNPDIDLEAVYTTAQKLTVQTPFLLALLVSQSLYETPLPKSIKEKKTPQLNALLDEALQYFKDDFTTLDEPQKKRIRFLFLQKLNSTKQNYFVALFIAAFKPTSVDYIHYQLPERLNFIYPLLRPLRLLYKYVFKRSLS